jgi:hypothetical protein
VRAGERRDYRQRPARRVVHRRDADGALRADGAVLLAATGASGVIKFHDPALVATFGSPDALAQ